MFTNYIRSQLHDQAVILEAGAHNGCDTIKLARLWPLGKIHAFEPNPFFKETLQNITKKYLNINFYPFALGSKTEETDLHASDGAQGGETIFPPNGDDIFWKKFSREAPSQLYTKTIKVSVLNLDEWAEKQRVTGIDFMRLDMQGAEGAVLKTCPKILKTVSFIQAEVSTSPLFSGIVLLPELKTFLEQEGFALLHTTNDHDGLHGDALFVRK